MIIKVRLFMSQSKLVKALFVRERETSKYLSNCFSFLFFKVRSPYEAQADLELALSAEVIGMCHHGNL